MRIELTQQDQAFRDQVRHFFLHDYPPDIIRKFDQGEDLDKEDLRASQRAMFRKGWAGGAWPSRYGGCGWTPLQNYLFQSEMAAAGALHLMRHVQEIMIAPVIYTFGDEPLQQRFLHAIKSGDILFCQGYSEPGAGSDLAALTTRAIRSDDCYLVTGTKLWTTFAHKTDWIFCLVRTNPDARPQEGISFLLIDLNSPGITITPVITLDGRHEVNQVHFDEVRVPISNRVGEENKGWTYAKFLLLQERSGISSAASNERSLRALRQLARMAVDDGCGSLFDQESWRRQLADIEVDLMALRFTEWRAVTCTQIDPSLISILKIKGCDIQQRISELAMEAAGYYALPAAPWLEHAPARELSHKWPGTGVAMSTYLNLRKVSIYGGTAEIQKNMIAASMLAI